MLQTVQLGKWGNCPNFRTRFFNMSFFGKMMLITEMQIKTPIYGPFFGPNTKSLSSAWKRWRSNDLDKMLKYSQLHSKLMLEINYLQSCKTRSVWSSCLYLGCININSVREKLKILSDITTNNIVIVMVLETKLDCPLLQRKKLWTSHHYQKTLTVFVPY